MGLSVQIEKHCGAFHLHADFQTDVETLALLGASGCGKSLTLKCIAGIERPDRGHIELDGRVLFDSDQRIDLPPQQRRVGYLFQQYALFPTMTVAQNIAAGAHKLPRHLRQQRVAQLMDMLQLKGLERHLPHQLSGGQQQRVALGRILASEPDAILLDEPFSALDSCLKFQLELELSDLLRDFPGTVVWVSHDRGEVYRNCNWVCLLEKGVSSPVIPMEQLMKNPGTVGAARLSGCTNFAAVVPTEDPFTIFLPAWNLKLQCAAPLQKGVTQLGIRSEGIRPAAADDKNVFSCTVVRTVEDLSTVIVLLQPEGSTADAPLLRMELPKSQWQPRSVFMASIPPEEILLLQ